MHKFLQQWQREREILGIKTDENTSNPETAIAEWYREHAPIKTNPRKSRKPIVREYALLIAPAPDGDYLAYCPAVYGFYSRGKTPAHARKQLAGNLRQYLADLAAKGKPLPRSNSRIDKLRISVAV